VTGDELAGSEYVVLEYLDSENDDNDTYILAATNGNAGKILDADNAVATIFGRMTNIRVRKSVTAASVGVEVV